MYATASLVHRTATDAASLWRRFIVCSVSLGGRYGAPQARRTPVPFPPKAALLRVFGMWGAVGAPQARRTPVCFPTKSVFVRLFSVMVGRYGRRAQLLCWLLKAPRYIYNGTFTVVDGETVRRKSRSYCSSCGSILYMCSMDNSDF